MASSSKKSKPSSMSSAAEIVGFDQDLLRCPVCSQFPREKVYQCNTGHSVCANCLPKLRKCPTCQGLYKNVRNYLVEGLLDSMKFECSWKDLGCTTAPMARNKLTSHEAQCDFDPNSVNFCAIFDKSCRKKLCPVLIQDPVEMNHFLDHVKSVHNFNVRDVNLKDYFSIELKYGWINDGCSLKGPWSRLLKQDKVKIFNPILRLKSTQDQGPQLFVVLYRFMEVHGKAAFLIKCVRLTDDNRGTNRRNSLSLCLTGREEDGPKVPDLNWTVYPQEILQLKDFWIGAQVDDMSSYHMVFLPYLTHYSTNEGIPIRCIFT